MSRGQKEENGLMKPHGITNKEALAREARAAEHHG